ncbi:hypothetical protein NZD89_07650 [Alicyclobacillus fastidiosus]|uniref:Uncharacterized protein n=1 Tax=Alicyclobacillus fastidiosus TaxID=392011 RepID=A0ABY6ZNI9_9BACL|nr:hypothetical protein NZD89_07650 [Alicyclobacillus fastidiosus]
MYIPALILIGAFNSNTPQQNAGAYVGQINNGGWDANQKFEVAKSGNFGFFSMYNSVNILTDSFEFIDGMVIDSDIKPTVAGNV